MLASLLLLLPTVAYIPPVAICLHCGTTAFACVHLIASFPALLKFLVLASQRLLAYLLLLVFLPLLVFPAVAGIPAVAGFLLLLASLAVSATVTAVFVG